MPKSAKKRKEKVADEVGEGESLLDHLVSLTTGTYLPLQSLLNLIPPPLDPVVIKDETYATPLLHPKRF